MTDRSATCPQNAWQSYWSSEQVQPAYATAGRLTAILDTHWGRVFDQVCAGLGAVRCLEIAAGNGDLSARLLNYAERKCLAPPAMFACDLVPNAARQLQSRPHIHALCCDAARLPCLDQSFGLVLSQFGIEYAGPDALAECARIVAPFGYVALTMHHQGGALHAENLAILAAVEAFQSSGLLPAFARFAGEENDPEARQAFIAAVKAAESVLHGHGPDIAAGSLLRLYREVATLHDRLSRYDRGEVSAWCVQMADALASYAVRTRWMIEVALSREGLDQALGRLDAGGLTILAAEPILDGDQPVAWSLLATRGQSR